MIPAETQGGVWLSVDATAPGDDDAAPAAPARRGRRVSDKVLIAFHGACDAREFVVARQLLTTLEHLINSPGRSPTTERRRDVETLVAAHERLWHLVTPAQD